MLWLNHSQNRHAVPANSPRRGLHFLALEDRQLLSGIPLEIALNSSLVEEPASPSIVAAIRQELSSLAQLHQSNSLGSYYASTDGGRPAESLSLRTPTEANDEVAVPEQDQASLGGSLATFARTNLLREPSDLTQTGLMLGSSTGSRLLLSVDNAEDSEADFKDNESDSEHSTTRAGEPQDWNDNDSDDTSSLQIIEFEQTTVHGGHRSISQATDLLAPRTASFFTRSTESASSGEVVFPRLEINPNPSASSALKSSRSEKAENIEDHPRHAEDHPRESEAEPREEVVGAITDESTYPALAAHDQFFASLTATTPGILGSHLLDRLTQDFEALESALSDLLAIHEIEAGDFLEWLTHAEIAPLCFSTAGGLIVAEIARQRMIRAKEKEFSAANQVDMELVRMFPEFFGYLVGAKQ